MNENDVGLLAKDPPLLFYIQFEAWKDSKDIRKDTGEVCSVSIEGRHLGIVGSIIIAEVIFGALMDRLEYEAASKAGPPELRESLKNLSNAFFPGQDNVFADVPPLDDMGELVPYIAKLAHLENAEPDFL